MLNKIWTAISGIFLIFSASSQLFAQTLEIEQIENSEIEETVTNEELENMSDEEILENEIFLEDEIQNERERVFARRLGMRFGLEFALTQALALNFASFQYEFEDSTRFWLTLAGGSALGLLASRTLNDTKTNGQRRTARSFHRISTILITQFYWFQQDALCSNNQSCYGHPKDYAAMLSFTSLASAITGIAIANNYPNIREEQPLRYQHGMYWSLIAGTLISMHAYNQSFDNDPIALLDEDVIAFSRSMIWSISGLALGFIFNKLDLFTAHEIVLMSELGIIGVFTGMIVSGITDSDLSTTSLLGAFGGGFGLITGYSIIHENPNTSFGRQFNSLVIAPNIFEHGEGHRVSGLIISGSF